MIEKLVLTPSHTGLGDLSEVTFLNLVADAHYRRLVQKTGVSPRAIVNKAGQPLYPSVVALELRASRARTIESHALWREHAIAIDVRAVGRNFIDVHGAIGIPDEDGDAPEKWADAGAPTVRWAGAWTVADATHEISMPTTEMLADIPRAEQAPALLSLHRAATARGWITEEPEASSPRAEPITYEVITGRDLAAGRQMMFSQFVVLMDYAERVYLTERLAPAFPGELVDHRTTLERRIVYAGNCHADDVVNLVVRARIEPPAESSDGANPAAVEAATLITSFELVERRSRRLLALGEAKKTFSIPNAKSQLIREMERMLASHARRAPLEGGTR